MAHYRSQTNVAKTPPQTAFGCKITFFSEKIVQQEDVRITQSQKSNNHSLVIETLLQQSYQSVGLLHLVQNGGCSTPGGIGGTNEKRS
jgi:hypothetical protein